MILETIGCDFSVCKTEDHSLPTVGGDFFFWEKTDEEISLVCPTDRVPKNVIAREDGFRAFRIKGTLDFSLIGILAPIAETLAQNKIGIFVVSTYNTDYVFVKNNNFPEAVRLLTEKGYAFI